MSSVAEMARDRLARLPRNSWLESVWLTSALEFLAGLRSEPDVDALKLSSSKGLWGGIAPWPREAEWDRVGAVFGTHHWAIARRDRAWLEELALGWETAPEEIVGFHRIKALGEIGLALGAGGARAHGWDADDEEVMLADGCLLNDAPDLCWRALVRGDWGAAKCALESYEARLAETTARRARSPEDRLRHALTYPYSVFEAERRALAELVERARSADGAR